MRDIYEERDPTLRQGRLSKLRGNWPIRKGGVVSRSRGEECLQLALHLHGRVGGWVGGSRVTQKLDRMT